MSSYSPLRSKLLDHSGDHLVDREQGSHPAPVVVGERVDLVLGKRIREEVRERRRLVGEVGLVEVRVAGQERVRVGVGVARSRQRRRSLDARPGLDRHRMRRVRGQAEEERLVLVCGGANRPLGEPAVDVGRVVVGLAAVGAQLAVVVQRVAVVVVGARVDAAVPIAPARGDLERVGLAVLVQVLADVDRPVAGPLQPDRNRLCPVELGVAAQRCVVPDHAVVVRVLAAEEGRARRAAEREVDDRLLEAGAVAGDQLAGLRHRRHRAEVLVVGHHDDHVRALRAVLRQGRGCNDEQRDQPDRCRGEPAAPSLHFASHAVWRSTARSYPGAVTATRATVVSDW